MTFAKGISSSHVPLGAVTVSDKVNAPFKEGAYFVHGFTDGALAFAAGLTLIDILKDGLVDQAAERGGQLVSYRERLPLQPPLADVRDWGKFRVLELVQPDAAGRGFVGPEFDAEKRFQEIALANGLVFYSTFYGPRRRPLMSRGLPMWISRPSPSPRARWTR